MKNPVAKLLFVFVLVMAANVAYSQCNCFTCSGKGKVAVEKPFVVPRRFWAEMDEIPTKTVLEICPTCNGTGNYCPPPQPCTRTCPTCSGSGNESFNYLHGNGQYKGECQTCSGSGKVSCN